MTAQDRYGRLRDKCRAGGLRMTPQRDALLRVLSRTRHHPTAAELYRAVRRSHASLSPATVYRNVQQLADAVVITTLRRAGVTRYDANPDEHHHFVCERCGTVLDIYLARVSYRIDAKRSGLVGTAVSGCDVQLRGRCATCRHRR